MPEHGWTCFHCGKTFLAPGPARRHFGTRPTSTPACRLDGATLARLRFQERVAAELYDALRVLCVRHAGLRKGPPEDLKEAHEALRLYREHCLPGPESPSGC